MFYLYMVDCSWVFGIRWLSRNIWIDFGPGVGLS